MARRPGGLGFEARNPMVTSLNPSRLSTCHHSTDCTTFNSKVVPKYLLKILYENIKRNIMTTPRVIKMEKFLGFSSIFPKSFGTYLRKFSTCREINFYQAIFIEKSGFSHRRHVFAKRRKWDMVLHIKMTSRSIFTSLYM